MTDTQIMVATFIVVLVILSLTGCAPEQREPVIRTVEVKVPVLERRIVPESLARRPLSDSALPLWVSPTDPKATSCLTAEGEAKKRGIDIDTIGRLDGFLLWGQAK